MEDFLFTITMKFINYNGKIFDENTPIITAQNRGLRYGDGIFETIKLKNGILILLEDHMERLWKGMEVLKFKMDNFFTSKKLTDEILMLAKKNNLVDARIRLTIIRGEGGIYDAVNHKPNYIIEAIGLPQSNGELNSNGLQLCFFEDARKSMDAFSNLKTNNYLPYFMGAIFAKENYCNDAIILNSNGNVCDTTIANIFYVKNEKVYTSSIGEGCVAGVMRKWLIDKIQVLGYSVIEKIVSKEDLLTADEIFLSNSIYNIRWVGNLEESFYTNNIIFKIVDALQRKEGAVFC
jgi:branched-chain amino acid aminotransferase